jgi:hypothetical protein
MSLELSTVCPPVVPNRGWTVAEVAERIATAFRVIEASSARVGPRAYGNAMPIPVRSFEDKVERKLEDWIEDVLAAADRSFSGGELRGADEALEWIRAIDDVLMRDAVTLVSLGRSDPRFDVDRMLRRRRVAADRMLKSIELRTAEELAAFRTESAAIRARALAWAVKAKNKPVRVALIEEAVRRKRKKRWASGYLKARRAAKGTTLTGHEFFAVKRARDRGIDIAARALIGREISELRKRVRSKDADRAEVMPGRSFNARQLYQWFDRGVALICERLNNENRYAALKSNEHRERLGFDSRG